MREILYIERMDIGAFGCLSGKSVCFKPGVNLIGAPNERGKSTLAAALKFALYGFVGQSHSISDNPKKMYSPWSGASPSVAVTFGGSRRLRIERSVQGSQERALCTDLATGKPLFTGLCFGEKLLGIGADTFEKTLFFSKLSPPESKDTALAEALQNLVFSADEQVGAEKAKKALSAYKNALRGRISGSGEIPRLELEEQQLEERLLHEKAAMAEISELEGAALKTEKAAAERERLAAAAEAELRNFEKYGAALKLAEYSALKERAKDAQERLAKEPYSEASLEKIEECRTAREERARAGARLREAQAELAEAREAIPEDGEDEEALLAAYHTHKSRRSAAAVLAAAGALLLAIGAASLAFLAKELAVVGFAALAVGAVAAAVAGALGLSAKSAAKGFGGKAKLYAAVASLPAQRAKRGELASAAEKAREKAAAAAAEFEVRSRAYAALVPDGRDETVDEMYSAYVRTSNLRVEKSSALDALRGFEQSCDVSELEKLAEGAEKPAKERKQIETEYRFASQSAKGLREKLGDMRGRAQALREMRNDPAKTESALNWTSAQLNSKRFDYDALCVALAELEAADDGMKASVSPRIASVAGDFFAAATGGKYGSLELDTRFCLSYESASGLKSAEHMSAGTREAAYLCLRLALLKLIYGEKSVPLFLDDAFAHTDDARLQNLLSLFCAVGNQVVLTSCTDREKSALSQIGAAYNEVEL